MDGSGRVRRGSPGLGVGMLGIGRMLGGGVGVQLVNCSTHLVNK